MKKFTGFVLATLVFVACGKNTNTESVAEAEDETANVEQIVQDKEGFYGEKITEEGAIEMEDFLAQIQETDSMSIKVKGTIEQTCKMKGCWMTVKTAEGETMRVTFKDYGFFVPKEGMEGKEVVLEGIAKKTVTSIENLKHYAQDGGATKEEIDAITEAEEGVAFEAVGVIIK